MGFRKLLSSLSNHLSRDQGAERTPYLGRRCRIESLEERRLLAITWMNEATNNFSTIYSAEDALIATQLVSRAIADWEAVITDFNYDGDNNPATNNVYNLTVDAGTFEGGLRASTGFPTFDANGLPTETTITMDDNGGDAGWFFDTTPLDDAEFTGIAGPFQASFVDATTVGQSHQNDFYRTIAHEIGHAMGVLLSNRTTLADRRLAA